MENLVELLQFEAIDEEGLEDVLLNMLVRNPRRNKEEQYGNFDLEALSLEEIKLNFRFEKDDLERLVRGLRLPPQIRTGNRYIASGIEGLLILLRRFSYPNRLTDLEPLFGHSAQYLSHIANAVMHHIYDNFNNLLVNLRSHVWLNQQKLNQYSQAVETENAPLPNCWAFIDGTAKRICRPSAQQEMYFSRHKRFHCVKYQSVLCPDGIIVSMMGAYPGNRHDAGILRASNLYRQLEQCCVFPNQQFVLYGDPAYGIRELLISPFRNRILTYEQQNFNTRMSAVCQAVEWGFGKIINEFAFLDFAKKQKLLLQDISEMYSVGTILTNCHTCLYGGQTSQYFNLAPPTLEECLGN